MTSCLRCGGVLRVSAEAGELSFCIMCGHREYIGGVHYPTAEERRKLPVKGLVVYRSHSGRYKHGRYGPVPVRRQAG